MSVYFVSSQKKKFRGRRLAGPDEHHRVKFGGNGKTSNKLTIKDIEQKGLPSKCCLFHGMYVGCYKGVDVVQTFALLNFN